jgi:uncharacterized protein YndB with AHSA1/START domain
MTTTTEATRSLTMEFDLPHPPAKVWRALTEPALVSKWLMTTDMKLSVGERFKFQSQPVQGWDGVIACEMKEVEPHTRLRYSWGSMGLETMVTFTLAPTPKGGTLLKLEQSGFPPAQKGQPPFFEGARMGWQGFAGKRLPEVLAELS